VKGFLLETRELSKRFGGVVALDSVSLGVEEGTILAVMGPNGSGKTTLFNLITGFFPATSGHVTLAGKPITGMRPHQLVRRGLVRTFQQTMVYGGQSVSENLEVALGQCPAADRRSPESLLDSCGLADLAGQRSDSLPYGLKKRLGVAMAVATGAKVLLLDEPGAGLGDSETAAMSDLIRALRSDGKTILLVDHNMRFVLPLSDRVVVLDQGRVIFAGPPEEARRNQAVVDTYLG
jgi:ABC-type branched-subunit amino acid transport system ATPase component